MPPKKKKTTATAATPTVKQDPLKKELFQLIKEAKAVAETYGELDETDPRLEEAQQKQASTQYQLARLSYDYVDRHTILTAPSLKRDWEHQMNLMVILSFVSHGRSIEQSGDNAARIKENREDIQLLARELTKDGTKHFGQKSRKTWVPQKKLDEEGQDRMMEVNDELSEAGSDEPTESDFREAQKKYTSLKYSSAQSYLVWDENSGDAEHLTWTEEGKEDEEDEEDEENEENEEEEKEEEEEESATNADRIGKDRLKEVDGGKEDSSAEDDSLKTSSADEDSEGHPCKRRCRTCGERKDSSGFWQDDEDCIMCDLGKCTACEESLAADDRPCVVCAPPLSPPLPAPAPSDIDIEDGDPSTLAPASGTTQTCRTCGKDKPLDSFYVGMDECYNCGCDDEL